MAEKFLILGSSSFYGSNFAKYVAEMGDDTIEASRPHWSLGDMIPDADYIVNFCSQSLVAESWVTPWDWAHTNLTQTTKLFEEARKRQFKKFIHVSTPEVYGSTGKTWVKEWQPFKPTTPYAVSRAAGDMMLKAYHKAYAFPAIITRTANIYGPGQPDYRIIPKAIAYKRKGGALPLHGGGASIRSFIHIRDACRATYLIAKNGKVGETYHISTSKAHGIKDVVEMIGCKWEHVPDRLGKDYAYLLNSDKVRDMGWTDFITLEEGLEECESYRSQ
jgi:dTDP-glucose 4,6-dehydratase